MRLPERPWFSYERLAGALPPDLAARLDRLRPAYGESWGGPLNGQERRREIVADLAAAIRFDRVIETGTFRATSTGYLADMFRAPVATVESNRRFFSYSRARLAKRTDVTVEYGDSRQFLVKLARAPSAPVETVFVYLDAHWEDDLPLADELGIVASGWPRCVVMVDDFQVPGDDGYAYDDYGTGRALVPSYLPPEVRDWSVMYPVAPSASETGARRGCCVLASPAVASAARVQSLR